MSEVSDARASTRRIYGRDLENKATDSYCLAVRRAGPDDVGRFGIEAGGGPVGGPALASVIEFSDPGRTTTHKPDRHAASTTLGAEGAEPVMDRGVRLHERRTAAYQLVGAVYDEVERLSASSLGPGPEVLGSPNLPTLVNQVCWLNRTVRTWAGPEVLADIAADPAVIAIDLPVPLEADAFTHNGKAIALPGFVEASGLTGLGVTVAVIDTEVAVGHPALSGRVIHRRNYTSEPWGHAHEHGTAVAGILAGQDETRGGVAPGATIYNYKVLGRSRLRNGDDFGGGLAIQQALEDGVALANCSWGAGPVGPGKGRLAEAVDQAWTLGMPVVKSAGNDGPATGTMTAPAEADGVIVVGATDIDGQAVQPYSSRGPAGSRPGPHVVAPGGGGANGNILACLVNGGFGDAGAGTSYAAPHVSGMIALWLQAAPGMTPDQLRDRLVGSARTLRVADRIQGAGLATLAS